MDQTFFAYQDGDEFQNIFSPFDDGCDEMNVFNDFEFLDYNPDFIFIDDLQPPPDPEYPTPDKPKNLNQPNDPNVDNVENVEMTYEQFCEYICTCLDPYKSILITCKMLIMVEKAFIEEFGDNWTKLRRDDKRKKENIFKRFYENANLIYKCIQSNPDKYLRYARELIVQKYAK